MQHDDLVRMINQICEFFAAYPPDEAVAGVEEHLRKFWDPSMRTQLLAAREQLAQSAAPVSTASAGATGGTNHALIDTADITGLILCGGAGSRFDGRDKPLMDFAGRPLVEHVRERLVPQVGRIVISCNRNAQAYGGWGDTIVADERVDQGPLAGVLAALNVADTNYLFVCPGDAPFLPVTLVACLAVVLRCHEVDVAIPRDGTRPQHLFMLIRRNAASMLQNYLHEGGRSVHGFIAGLRCTIVDTQFESRAFLNINSPADLLDAINQPT